MIYLIGILLASNAATLIALVAARRKIRQAENALIKAAWAEKHKEFIGLMYPSISLDVGEEPLQ